MARSMRSVVAWLIGEFRWSAPPWLAAIAAAWRARPRLFWGVIAAIVLLSLLTLGGYVGWRMLPEPVLTQVAASPPDVTRVGADGTLYPQPVTLHFETTYSDPTQEGPRNAARLALLGKTLTEGIRLTPEHPGEWRWVDENTLRFTTNADWPAGTRYTVHLTPALFAQGIELADATPTFTTPEIAVELEKLALYQNPKQPSEHRVVATLRFTHAVNADSLKQHLKLTMRPSGASVQVEPRPYEYTLEIDQHGRVAYVTSAPVDLPKHDNFMTLTLARGVAAKQGESATDEKLQEAVRIPAVSTFFRVDSLETRIVRDHSGTPLQTLVLEVTDGIQAERVAQQLKAYLLPEGENWQRGEVTRKVLAHSTSVELTANPTAHPYSKLLTFTYHAPQDGELFVVLPAGLESHGGFTMTVPYRDVLNIPDYPTELNIVGEGGLLALSGSQTIALQARGLPAIKVEVYQLRDSQFVHLITQTRGDLEDANFVSYHFDEDNIARRYEEVLPLHAAAAGEAAYTSLDLSRFLTSAGMARGMFVINVRGWDPQDDSYIAGARDRRFILLTDLAVIAKDNAGGSHDIFVHSLVSGQPVPDATIELLGVNGLPVYTTHTGRRGHAHIPDVSGFAAGRTPAVYLVRHDGDVSFLPFERADRQLNYSRFPVGGLRPHEAGGSAQLQAVVFTDRGIYRPGDSGHLGIIVKRNDWGSVKGVPIEIVLEGPQGNRVRRRRLALPVSGFFQMELEFAANASTGAYQATVYLLDDDNNRRNWLGSETFRVEMFEPDTLRIHARVGNTPARGWHTSLQLHARVTVENLFGLPAQDNRVTGRYVLTPTRFEFDAYPGFNFTNPFGHREDRLDQRVTRKLGDTTTNGSGAAVFDIDLSQYGRGVYQLVFMAEGFETGGGDSVSATTRIRVSPAKRLVGWATASNLDYLPRGSRHTVRFIAINPALETIAADNLKLRLVERRHVSTLVRRKDGTLAYQTITKRVPVQTQPFAIGAEGRKWQVPTDTPGDYVAEVLGTDGRVLASVRFTVAGERNLTGATTRNARLRIDLDQASYRPGERVELQITAPYTGAGLITVERDQVYTFKWFATDSRRTIEHIRVPEGIEGNAYVNVTFVRALDSPRIFTDPLSYAVAPFAIDRSKRTVDIELHTPDKVKPGETLPIRFQTSQPGRIVVYAVDEGILQVSGYDTPEPLDTFLQKRALTVETQQVADLLMPEFRLLSQRLAAGGGEKAEAALKRNLNPFARNVKAPVVYWSGIIEATGEPQTVTYAVPDYFDGQLTIMAVAVADKATGSAETHTLVRGPFVLQPSVINVAAPGDGFEVSVGVTNALPEGSGEAEITVQLHHDTHLAVTGPASVTLTLAPGAEGRATFNVRATQTLGSAELVFHASAGEHTLDRAATLSVRPPVPYRTRVRAGTTTGGTAEVTLGHPLLPALAEQQAALGYSPVVLAGALNHYLRGYPYTCSEQLISGVFGQLTLLGSPVLSLDRSAVMARYRDVLNTLRRRQLPNGGFAFWPGANKASPVLSIYATQFLTVARQMGAVVPERLFRPALDHLRVIATHDPAAVKPYLQAFAIYVLTRNGRITTNMLTRLQTHLEQHGADNWQQTLAAAYMAASYRQLKLNDLAGKLIGDYVFARPGDRYFWPMDSALARNAQYIYLLARHFPARLSELGDQPVRHLAAAIAEHRYNTFSASYTLLALGAWQHAARTSDAAPLRIAARIQDQSRTLAKSRQSAVRAEVPLDASRLRFTGADDTRLFYTTTRSGYRAQPPEQAVADGVRIIREYLNAEGEVVTQATQGSTLTVRIRVRALSGQRLSDVAIVALLPGGFEVQRDSLRGGQGGRVDYIDIREDRVVLYTSVGSEVRTFTWRVQVTGEGSFTVPPVYADPLYAPGLKAVSEAGRFHVTAP